MAPTEHLKMMRLLFLCLLLLLPAATAVSEEIEGSADDGPDDDDDEDLYSQRTNTDLGATAADKTTGIENAADNFTVIVIVVAVAVLVLSVAAIVTIMLVRRHAHNRQQGVYSVPTEQDQKGAV
ncbi:hypothetical protein ABVT39_006952 [Epinephelus coioides]